MTRTSLAIAVALTATLSAQSPLETTFAFTAGNTFVVTNTPTPITGLFDLTVTEPQGIVLTQIDIDIVTSHGTNGQLGIWMTAAGGTHVGNEMNASVWTQMSSATQVHNGGRVSFVLSQPIALSPATYGFAFHCIEANPRYHGGAYSATLPQTYASTEISVDLSAARMRTSDPVDPFGGTAAGFSPRQPAVAMFYSIGATSVDFTSDVTTGPSPLTVQFTSVAVSGAPGGILVYAWDLDGDGLPDSNAVDPQFTYTTCGSYTVSLTIGDITGSYTETKMDYIVTDVVTPSFTNEIIGPLTVQFTDTSTPTPDTWEWDLDGDGLTDSTAQNPVFVYTNGCEEVAVSLTASLSCSAPVTLTKEVAVATTLETTFQGGLITAAAAPSSANYFDVDVTNPLGVTVCGMHVNSGVAAGMPVTVNLYQTEGTYVGATGDATLWRLVGSETVNAAAGARTFVPFSSPVHLAFGTYGICMEHIGASPVYTNLGAIQVYGNADLTITAGLSQGDPVFDPASTTFSPRIANIALHYATSQSTGVAGYGYIGSGCAGSLGVPSNVSTTQPVIGGQATIVVDNLPFGFGVMAIGAVRTPPVDLVIIGMPGCRLFHTADVLATLLGVGNSATFNIPVPNNAGLIGVQLFTQPAAIDPGLNMLELSIGDAAVLLVGL